MYEFEYSRATSLGDAASRLSSDEDARLVAGGMTLLPTLKQRLAKPSQLIDLAGIAELKGIKRGGRRGRDRRDDRGTPMSHRSPMSSSARSRRWRRWPA